MFLRLSPPLVFLPDGVVESMGDDICACRIHCDDDNIGSSIFELEQTVLLCDA